MPRLFSGKAGPFGLDNDPSTLFELPHFALRGFVGLRDGLWFLGTTVGAYCNTPLHSFMEQGERCVKSRFFVGLTASPPLAPANEGSKMPRLFSRKAGPFGLENDILFSRMRVAFSSFGLAQDFVLRQAQYFVLRNSSCVLPVGRSRLFVVLRLRPLVILGR